MKQTVATVRHEGSAYETVQCVTHGVVCAHNIVLFEMSPAVVGLGIKPLWSAPFCVGQRVVLVLTSPHFFPDPRRRVNRLARDFARERTASVVRAFEGT